jgi:hypothetical protein
MADTSAPEGAAPPARPAAGDRAAVEHEVADAGDDRTALEALQARYQTRISRRPADFAATHGLTLVERRLGDLGHGADPWDRSVRKLLR